MRYLNKGTGKVVWVKNFKSTQKSDLKFYQKTTCGSQIFSTAWKPTIFRVHRSQILEDGPPNKTGIFRKFFSLSKYRK